MQFPFFHYTKSCTKDSEHSRAPHLSSAAALMGLQLRLLLPCPAKLGFNPCPSLPASLPSQRGPSQAPALGQGGRDSTGTPSLSPGSSSLSSPLTPSSAQLVRSSQKSLSPSKPTTCRILAYESSVTRKVVNKATT